MLTPDTRLGIQASHVAAKVLEGEAIIINLATGLYYSLAGVGGEVWTLIEAEQSIAEMGTTLSSRYGVQQSEVVADLERLALQLLEENLVCIAAADGRPRTASSLGSTEAGKYEPPKLHAYDDMAELLALDPPMPGLRIVPETTPASRFEP
jgi:coenzyme PQQ synthesis protein D (PqqD)